MLYKKKRKQTAKPQLSTQYISSWPPSSSAPSQSSTHPTYPHPGYSPSAYPSPPKHLPPYSACTARTASTCPRPGAAVLLPAVPRPMGCWYLRRPHGGFCGLFGAHGQKHGLWGGCAAPGRGWGCWVSQMQMGEGMVAETSSSSSGRAGIYRLSPTFEDPARERCARKVLRMYYYVRWEAMRGWKGECL